MEEFGKSYKRRIALFSDEDTIYALRNDRGGRKLLNSQELTIIEMEKYESFINKFNILDGVIPTNEMMLVLSPFDDNTYMELSRAKNLTAIEKYGSTIRLCQYLGAKTIKILSINIYDRESQKELALGVNTAPAAGNLTMTQKDMLSLKNKIAIETSFAGGASQYDIALEFLKQKRLMGDIFLSNLLELRNPNLTNNNPIKTYNHTIILTEDLQSTFDLVASLQFPVGFFKTSYHSFVKEKTEISLKIQIDF